MQTDIMVIKSLNADLKAVSASLAAAENRVKALEAENEQLRKALEAIEARIDVDFKVNWRTNMNAAIKQLLDDEIAIKLLCIDARKALQAKEAE